MPRKTQISSKHKTTFYSTRNMRLDLLDRMRVLALRQRMSMEDVMNRALAVGLAMIEQQRKAS